MLEVDHLVLDLWYQSCSGKVLADDCTPSFCHISLTKQAAHERVSRLGSLTMLDTLFRKVFKSRN